MLKTGGAEKKQIKTVAKSQKKIDSDTIILGVRVSGAPKKRVLEKITRICEEKDFIKPLFVVTAYSEFFLEKDDDNEFSKALNKADLILPDGVSVPAACDYLRLAKGSGWMVGLWRGLKVGVGILRGEYADKTISGVGLTEELFKLGGEKGWRIFLLGGFEDVAGKLAGKMKQKYPGTKIEWDGAGKNETEIVGRGKEILEKITRFEPHILFVAMGRYRQEKWIANNLMRLKTRVVIGVGSSFDELLGEGVWATKPPQWVEKMGLKWLWRVFKDPKHLGRAWRAFPVFGVKIYKER